MELFAICLIIFIVSGVGLIFLTGYAEEVDGKLKRIHQELIDSVVNETSRLDSSLYDFIDTIACKVPTEQGALKRFECTSIHSSSTKGSVVVTFGSIGGDIPIDAIGINPIVETVFLERGDILDVQISINEERSSISSGQLGGRTGQALIGTILFGVAGGQIGSSGKRSISMTSREEVLVSSLALEIFTRSADHPYLFIHFFPNMRSLTNTIATSDAVPSSTIADKTEYKQLKKWYSLFLALKSDAIPHSEAQRDSFSSDIASQISRLNELKEQGILSDDEFDAAKKKILDS